MLSAVAHQGAVQGPHDLWGAWSADPLVVTGLVAAGWLHLRGARRRRVTSPERALAFHAAVLVVAVALLSPLDAVSAELASAHMVQHVLLVVVAAPLLAWSRPLPALLAGAPALLRPRLGALRRRAGAWGWAGAPAWPYAAWLLHTGTVWAWHASGPYEAAVTHDHVHALEHAGFLGTGLLFWWLVVGGHHRTRVSRGHAALLTFAMALQGVFLAALLTFATTPWYPVYGDTRAWWGLDPLADQQLAGAIMWVPAGFVYVGLGILLVMAWMREGDRRSPADVDDWGFATTGTAPTGTATTGGGPPAPTEDEPPAPSRPAKARAR